MYRKTSIKSWEWLKNYHNWEYEHDEWVVISGHYFRCPKTTAEKRMNSDPDHIPYVRGRRKTVNLPDAWDDRIIKSGKRSWKLMYKCRNQWMKAV